MIQRIDLFMTETPSDEFMFRQAKSTEVDRLWSLILQAKERLRLSGCDQWQGPYPSREDIQKDLFHGNGYILTVNDEPTVYGALIFDPEPAYASIQGAWGSDLPYVTLHRLAVASHKVRQGWAKQFMQEVESLTRLNNLRTIRVDTHADNSAMQALLRALGYHYRGKIFYPHGERLAFDKILS